MAMLAACRGAGARTSAHPHRKLDWSAAPLHRDIAPTLLADADRTALRQHPPRRPRRPVAVRADQHHVRDMQGRLDVDDTRLARAPLPRLGMTLNDVRLDQDHALLLGQ